MSPRIFRSPFSGWNFRKDKFWSEQEIRTGENFLGDKKYAYINRLNTKIRSTMLCLSGFKLYSRWVPLFNQQPEKTVDISRLHHWFLFPAKWPLRNERKSSILLTCHFPNLRIASDWMKQFAGQSVVASQDVSCFLRLSNQLCTEFKDNRAIFVCP